MNRTIDVSKLPDYAFGFRSITRFGTLGFILIEGFGFVLLIFTYFYLYSSEVRWPPSPPPDLFYGTLNLIVLLASVIPNQLTKRAGEREDLAAVRRGMAVCLGFGVVFVVIRGFEFTTLNCRWSDNGYASAVWATMVLHTTHLVADVADTSVLAVLMFLGPDSRRRFVDVAENSFYWNFVVASWVVLYALVYWAPRWL
ncbi:MAG TPA: cytochrome c oxidase subunit 3 [Xanthobacteraceae bacterium]|nr:cytochrome c oxidase subunit 3 [Xanthobacteraceae bacterium]